MATRYIHKGSITTGKVPVAADLNVREIYVNGADGKAYTRTTGDQIVTLNPPDQATWNGPTLYRGTACATFAFSGTTDANGRVTFNLTKDGTASGIAIFSTVFTRWAQAYATSTTDSNKYPYAVIESFTAKTVTVRCLMGVTLLLLSNTTAFAPAGYKVDLCVTGAI